MSDQRVIEDMDRWRSQDWPPHRSKTRVRALGVLFLVEVVIIAAMIHRSEQDALHSVDRVAPGVIQLMSDTGSVYRPNPVEAPKRVRRSAHWATVCPSRPVTNAKA